MTAFLAYLEDLPWAVGAIIMVGAMVVLAILGVIITRKMFNQKTLRSQHDVAAVVFANIGVLYAVLLGFTVVNVQQRFDKLRETAHIEAAYLTELYRDSAVFTPKDKERIRSALRGYGDSILKDEWEMMNQRKVSDLVNPKLHRIWEAYYNITPQDSREIAWYQQSITKLNDLINARLARIIGSKESLGEEMWSLLLIGGLVMISFIGFFGLESLKWHLLMASVLAALTAFLLFLIYSLDTPFSGNITLSPTIFDHLFQAMD